MNIGILNTRVHVVEGLLGWFASLLPSFVHCTGRVRVRLVRVGGASWKEGRWGCGTQPQNKPISPMKVVDTTTITRGEITSHRGVPHTRMNE